MWIDKGEEANHSDSDSGGFNPYVEGTDGWWVEENGERKEEENMLE